MNKTTMLTAAGAVGTGILIGTGSLSFDKGTVIIACGIAGMCTLAWCWRTLNTPPELTSSRRPSEAEDQAAFVRNYYSTQQEMQNLPATETQGREMLAPGSVGEQYLTYEIVAQLWKQHAKKSIQFTEIARFWRDTSSIEKPKPREVNFQNPDIARFYVEWVLGKPFFTGLALSAIQDILEVLDQEGYAPSVVDLHPDEPEKRDIQAKHPSTYKMLHKLPLYKHSLNTAEEITKRMEPGLPTIPKAVIAALSHDLGKLPSRYNTYYTSATHSFASVAVIESMPGVRNLPYYDSIREAVKNHHIQSEVELDKHLREADQAARRREMADMEKAKSEKSDEATTETIVVDESTGEILVESEQSVEDFAPETADTPVEPTEPVSLPEQTSDIQQFIPPPSSIFGGEEEKAERQRAPRMFLDISAWFNADKVLNEILRITNTRIGDETFWSALSLHGYVYVKPVALWEAIGRSTADENGNWHTDLQAASISEHTRDDIVFTVISLLKKRKRTVATEFLGQGHAGAMFARVAKDGKTASKMYLIPLQATAFGDDGITSEIESRKDGKMMNTKEIMPLHKWSGPLIERGSKR